MQVGHSGGNKGSNDLENFGRVAKIWVDPKTNEAYIADGYLNKRVAVLDADTGKMKRYWGAYGNKPDDTNLGPYNPDAPPAQQDADLPPDVLHDLLDAQGDVHARRHAEEHHGGHDARQRRGIGFHGLFAQRDAVHISAAAGANQDVSTRVNSVESGIRCSHRPRSTIPPNLPAAFCSCSSHIVADTVNLSAKSA